MKAWFKKNYLWILAAFAIFFYIQELFTSYNVIDSQSEFIKKIEKEKVLLKKEIVDILSKIPKKKEEIKEIVKEKEIIIKKNNIKPLKVLKKPPVIASRKTANKTDIVKHKGIEIKKTASIDKVWAFTINIKLDYDSLFKDFTIYRDLDVKEKLKYIEIIDDLEKAIRKGSTLNDKNELIISENKKDYRKLQIKNIKVTKKYNTAKVIIKIGILYTILKAILKAL